MKAAPWKRWWSYLTELHIESAPSPHNPHLYVSLRRGRYQLSTANAIYSYEDLYDNFSRAFEQLDLGRLPGEEVLLLGFGLGSIPMILEKQGLDFHYTGVEIDESVIYLASKYTLPQIDARVELICADAFAYVWQTQQQFDLIAMDVFLDDAIPDRFQEAEFLQRLGEMLRPGGLLMYNRLAYTPEDIQQARRFYEQPFLEVFPQGQYLEVRGNWMLLNTRDFNRR